MRFKRAVREVRDTVVEDFTNYIEGCSVNDIKPEWDLIVEMLDIYIKTSKIL